MNITDPLVKGLPDAVAATRFFDQFAERNPSDAVKLVKNKALFSDVLTIASFSPLLAITLIQNPAYVWWLNRKRAESSVRTKDELLESLARFTLTNSQVEPQVLFARFRRRELLRIFLRDIRRLGTIAEITEEISNLADAILESALRIARQELDNRYGSALEAAASGRKRPSDICIVSLGKLGSRELNYSSDIDLLFIYSAEGSTTDTGSRDAVTNREYFTKLAESIIGLVGRQTGEGAAYRVDVRLRPHGRIGPLALSVKDTAAYYAGEAQDWERQVLIRSRASAGHSRLYKALYGSVETAVFSASGEVEAALRSVFLSKEKIDEERKKATEFNVKLGRGGIREIEFIAQALQLAYGGKDKWLRVPHTLISLMRLADRGLLSESELTDLADAYDLLRRLEHLLQMENGLQTHSVPNDRERLELIAARSGYATVAAFEMALRTTTGNVHETFLRVFGQAAMHDARAGSVEEPDNGTETDPAPAGKLHRRMISSLQKNESGAVLSPENLSVSGRIASVSHKFAELLTARPMLAKSLKMPSERFPPRDYRAIFSDALTDSDDLGSALSLLRTTWSPLLLEIAAHDIFQVLAVSEVKRLQTDLAEASIETALAATVDELSRRYSIEIGELPFSVLGLGKLGGGAIDYESDLDLILIRETGENAADPLLADIEVYGRAVEIFVNMLSSVTRDGDLYRVDLRLRPYGKDGPSVSTSAAFIDYIRGPAAIWELLAYVQLRGIFGPSAGKTEKAVADAVRERASTEEPDNFRNEARRIRRMLESRHGTPRSDREIDIKFGAGGLLDVYFVARYLYLQNWDKDLSAYRSTSAKLDEFRAGGSLSAVDHSELSEGYRFLSELDHNIRLTVGRVSRLPRSNQAAIDRIAERMRSGSANGLIEDLTIHRLNIRRVLDKILDP